MIVTTIAIMLITLLSSSQPLPLNATRSVLSRTRLGVQAARVCRSMSTRDLVAKLDAFGGYNRRYQAISQAQASKFPNLLKKATLASRVNLTVSAIRSSINVTVRSLIRASRKRRQVTSSPQTNLTSVALRGSLDQYGFQRLCTEWSAITTLPTDHFPRYLNEVICDSNDQHCLTYEGVCVQGSFVVNVLKNTGVCGSDGVEQWILVSQPLRTCCDCRLNPGSFLSMYV